MEFLDQFEQKNSFLEIKAPNGKPAGLTVELQAMDSDAVRAVNRRLQAANMLLDRSEFTPEKAEEDQHTVYAACIVSWKWADGVTLNGAKSPACTISNKLAILKRPKIFKQIDAHLAKDENFLSASGDTSPA